MSQAEEPSLNVIAVDDEPDNLRLIERVLRPHHKVQSYVGPGEALDAFGRTGCDVLITDFKMPHMSGVQLAQAIHNSEGQTPVVIMSSAYADTQDVLNAHREGLLDVILLKPWKFEDLKNSMRRASVLLELRRASTTPSEPSEPSEPSDLQ